jgi:hypothetical protein
MRANTSVAKVPAFTKKVVLGHVKRVWLFVEEQSVGVL